MVLEGMAKDKVTTKVLSTYLLLYLQTHARLQPNQQSVIAVNHQAFAVSIQQL
jgi:hypothetical protein